MERIAILAAEPLEDARAPMLRVHFEDDSFEVFEVSNLPRPAVEDGCLVIPVKERGVYGQHLIPMNRIRYMRFVIPEPKD